MYKNLKKPSTVSLDPGSSASLQKTSLAEINPITIKGNDYDRDYIPRAIYNNQVEELLLREEGTSGRIRKKKDSGDAGPRFNEYMVSQSSTPMSSRPHSRCGSLLPTAGKLNKAPTAFVPTPNVSEDMLYWSSQSLDHGDPEDSRQVILTELGLEIIAPVYHDIIPPLPKANIACPADMPVHNIGRHKALPPVYPRTIRAATWKNVLSTASQSTIGAARASCVTMHAKTIHHAKEYTLRYSSTSRPTAPTPVRRSGLSFRGRGLLELKAQRGLVEGMGTRVRPEVVFAATVERERVFDGDVAHVLQAVNAEKRRSRRESGNQAMVGVEFKSTLLGGSVREEPVVQVVPFLTEEVDAWASVIPGKTVVEEIVEGSVESVASKASKATTESDSWLAAERAKLFQDWGRRESDASGSKTTDSNEKVAEISSHESKEYSSRLESPSSTSEVKMITSKLDTDFISHESIKSISPVLDSFNSMRSASKDEFKYSKDELANQPVVLTPVATLAIDGLDEPNWGDMVSPEASALSSAAVEVVAHSDLIVQQHSNLIPEPVTKTMADSKILPGSASIHTSKTSLNLPSTTEPDYLKNAWTAELPIALPVVEQTIFTCTPQSEAEGPNAQSQESPSRLVSMIRNGIHEDNDAGKLSRRHSKTSDQSGSSVISMTDHSADDDTQKRSSEIFGSFKLKSASNSSTSLFSKLKGGHHSDRKSSKNNEGSLHAIESKSKSQRSSETKSPISQSVTPSMECLKEDDGEPKDESKKQASISSLKSMSSGVRSLVGKIKSSHHSLGPESLIKSQQVLKSSEKLDLLNATKSLLEPSSPIRPVEPVKMDVLIESAAISDLPLATKSNFSPIDVVQPATYAAETASEASKQSEMEVSKTTPESCQQSLKESGPRAPSPATKPIMSSNKSSQESLKANVPGKVMKSESQNSVASQLVPTTVTSKLLKSSDGVIASAKAAWEAEANKQSVKIPVSMQRSESEVPSPAPICQQVLAATDVASIEKATKNKTRNESGAAIFGPKNSDAFDSKSLEQLKMSPPGTYASRIGGEQKPAVSLKSIKLATVTTSDKERKVVFKEPQTTSVITVKPGLPATLQAEVAKSPDIEHKAKNAPSPEIQTTSTANTSIPLQTSEPLTELETACSVAVPVPKQFDPNSSSNAIPLKPKSSKFMSAMDQMNLEKQELPEHLRKESPESGEPSVKELWDSSRKSFQKSSNNITSTLSPTASKFTESETDMESVKKVDAVVSIEASPAEKEKKRIQETNARPADIMIQTTPAEKEKLRQQDAVMQAETPPTAVTTSNNAEASSRKKVEEPKAPLPTADVMSAKVTFEKAKCQVRVENGEFTCIDEKTNKPLLPSLEMRRIVKADNTPGRPEVTLHVCAPRDKGKAGSKFRELVLSFEGGPSKAKVWADGLMVLVYGAVSPEKAITRKILCLVDRFEKEPQKIMEKYMKPVWDVISKPVDIKLVQFSELSVSNSITDIEWHNITNVIVMNNEFAPKMLQILVRNGYADAPMDLPVDVDPVDAALTVLKSCIGKTKSRQIHVTGFIPEREEGKIAGFFNKFKKV